jgi:hypothetical protein
MKATQDYSLRKFGKIPQRVYKERKEAVLAEIIKVSGKLNGKFITLAEFERYNTVPGLAQVLHQFGGIRKLNEEAGLKQPKKFTFFETREQLKATFLNISEKYDGGLSSAIICKELDKSVNDVSHLLGTYFNGIKQLCSELGVAYVKTGRSIGKRKAKLSAEQSRTIFEKQLSNIARNNNKILSYNILNAALPNLNPTMMRQRIGLYFGGLQKFCEERSIRYEGFRSINTNMTELEILKNIKEVSKMEGAEMSEAFYRLNGKFSLSVVNQYYGTFKKACEEINVKVVK